MERECHVLLVHLIEQQSVSLYHNKSVTCLEGHYNVIKVVLSTHLKPLHYCLFHGERRVAI